MCSNGHDDESENIYNSWFGTKDKERSVNFFCVQSHGVSLLLKQTWVGRLEKVKRRIGVDHVCVLLSLTLLKSCTLFFLLLVGIGGTFYAILGLHTSSRDLETKRSPHNTKAERPLNTIDVVIIEHLTW